MPTIGNNQFPYPNTSDEPNIPGDLQKLALAVDTAIGGGNRFVATLSDLQKIPNTQLFNGMRATVTSDPMAVNNGEYVVSGGAWVSQTHAYWQGKARRSDGQLNVNNGTTNLKITADKDGGLPVQLQGDAAGTRISGLQGDHLVSLRLPVGGGQSWTSVGYQLRGNPIVMLGGGSELAKPSGFGSLDLTSVIRFTTSSDGIVIVLNSNPDVPMRSDMTISIMKL